MSEIATTEQGPPPLAVLKHQLELRGAEFHAALPAHIPVERFMRVVMTAVQQNRELLECNRASLFNEAMKAAQDGLLPDGRLGALIVRKNKNSPTGKSCNWQPMIAGIRQKARNSGDISTWDAHVVRAADHFQFQLGDNPQINHSYDLQGERGVITGAYSVAILKDGTKSFEVMSIGEIHAIRDRSDAWKAFKAGYIKSTPWSTDEGEMCRKTVARRHSKMLPMSTDLDDLMRRDDDLYDMKGAGDEKRQVKRPGLTEAFDRLAAPTPTSTRGGVAHDPETGEIHEPSPATATAVAPSEDEGGGDVAASSPPDQPQGGSQTAAAPASGNPTARPAEASQRPPERRDATDIDQTDIAYEMGRQAQQTGMARKAVPAEYRGTARIAEADAWVSGWDAGFNGDPS